MKSLILRGSESELVGKPSIKHELFYKFLLISPSYSLAHKVMTKKIKISRTKLPKDFPKVLETYKLIGNIYEISFDDWWDKVGRLVLMADKKALQVPVRINLANTREKIIADIAKLIDRFDRETLAASSGKICLLQNKIRIQTLEERHELAYIKARWSPEINHDPGKDLGKKLPNWFIALEAKKFLISYKKCKYIEKIKIDDRKTSANILSRNYLGMLVDRNLSEALRISENAARGIFPSSKSSNSHLRFNYEEIFDNRLAQLHFHYETLLRKNAQGKKGYTQGRVMKKEKIIKKIDDLNSLVEQKAVLRAREIVERDSSI